MENEESEPIASKEKPEADEPLDTSIFRQGPLERLSNPEQLDALLVIVTPRLWLALISIITILAVFVLWAIFASIPVTVQGRGIVMNEKERLFTISTTVAGVLKDINLKAGAIVKAGDVIAEISDHDYDLKIVEAGMKVASLERDLSQLKEGDEKEVASQRASINAALANAKLELEHLEGQRELYTIRSPKEGKVLELLANDGDILNRGSPLVWLELPDDANAPYVVYSFFHVEQGKKITVGTQAYISVSTFDAQEFGYLLGKVTDVTGFAVSREAIAKTIYNRELVDYLVSGDTAVVEVTVALDRDPDTGDYLWTSGRKPPTPLTTGTVCVVQATVHRLRPIYYILPIESLKYE